MFSLALAAPPLLVTQSAYVGSWTTTYSSSGTVTATSNGGTPITQPWVATSSGGSYPMNFPQGTNGSLTSSGTITATLTWVPNPSLPSDPAPPSVLVQQTASAAWSGPGNIPPPRPTTETFTDGGTADGLHDPAVAGIPVGSSETSQTTVANFVTKSGGTITLTCSPNVSVSFNGTQRAGPGGNGTVTDSWGYSVSIHAQPYGWYCAGWDDPNGTHHDGPNITGGTMTFVWGWKSTSGNLSDLAGITMYEIVDYSGNPGTFNADNTLFYPQSPPIQAGYHVPNGRAGSPINPTTLYARDTHSPFPVISATPITFTIPQKYEFDDTATGEVGPILYDCGNIVEGNFLNPSRWDITELGSTAHTYYN